MSEETAILEPTQESPSAETSEYVSIFDEPETQDEPSSAEPVTEEAADEPEAEASEETAETDDTDWLPNEQLKEFPADVVAKYAKRYGYTEEELSADPRLARTLKDKINSDIEIASRRKAAEEAEAQQELGLEQEEDATAEPTHVDTVQVQAQREAAIAQFVDTVTDKQVAVKFTDDFTKAFEIKDPEQRALAVTKTLTRGMVNLFPDLVQAYLGGQNGYLESQIKSFLNSNYEGLGEQTQQTSRSRAWDSVRQSDPKFAALPAFGTPQFTEAISKVAETIPGFENAVFTDPRTGKVLPASQQFAAKAKIAAGIMASGAAGNSNAVAVAEKAVQKGIEIAKRSAQTKSNAKLGAGQSKGLVKPSTGNDDLFGSAGEVQISQRLVGKR